VADGEYGYYAQQTTRTRTFIGDADGTILRKTDNGNVQNLYYAGDKAIGSVAGSAASPVADFDFNYAPVSDSYPAVSPGNYTVVSGDTLRGIAYKAYGDAKLWYLIADANGLMTDGDMHVGQALKIPNRITNVHNDYQTNKVYNAAEIIGDITPTLPDPPPTPQASGGDGGCGGFGSVLIMVVAIVATALTAGAAGQSIVLANAAAEGIAAELALSVFSAGELAAVGFANPLAAGLSYAAGNLAGQVAGNLAGVQDGINFGQIASAGLSGALGSVFADAVGTQALKGAGIDNPSLQTAVSYGARSILNQGINLLTGQQQSFDWRQVASAAISAPLVNLALSGVKGADAGSRMAQTVIGDVVRQSVSSMFYAGGRVNFANIASAAFGDTLGTALSIASFEKASQQEEKLEVSGIGQINVPSVLLGDLNPSKYQLLAQSSAGTSTDGEVPSVTITVSRNSKEGDDDIAPRRVNDQMGTMRQFFMLDDLHLDQATRASQKAGSVALDAAWYSIRKTGYEVYNAVTGGFVRSHDDLVSARNRGAITEQQYQDGKTAAALFGVGSIALGGAVGSKVLGVLGSGVRGYAASGAAFGAASDATYQVGQVLSYANSGGAAGQASFSAVQLGAAAGGGAIFGGAVGANIAYKASQAMAADAALTSRNNAIELAGRIDAEMAGPVQNAVVAFSGSPGLVTGAQWNKLLSTRYGAQNVFWDWPKNQGFVYGADVMESLRPGQLIGRLGNERGTFASALGTTPESLSLRPGTDLTNLNVYRVVQEIPGTRVGPAAPAFDMPGYGTQFQLPKSIKELLDPSNRYLERVAN
jgi:LysM repeat protein